MGLSRSEFFARIGLLQEVDPLTELAYNFAEQQDAGKSDQGAAVKDLWHLSHHGSQFPGDDPKACGRASLYTMMDIPRPFGSYFFSHRKLTQISDAGKDIEDRLVDKWYNAGYLVSAPIWAGQTVFENSDAWLTSTVDSIVLWPRSVMPIVAEVKSKYANVIADMQRLIRGPDEKHVKQIKTQIAMARADAIANPRTVKRCFNSDRLSIAERMPILHTSSNNEAPHHVSYRESHERYCPQHGTDECLVDVELVPPEYGYLYYVSRDNPSDSFEFFIEYDPKFYEAGVAKLQEWREHFIKDELPQTNFVDKRYAHPFAWKWGDQPCKYCDHGDECRVDTKKAIERGEPIKLSESDAIETARAARPDYDFDLVRDAVYKRWGFVPDVV